MDTVCYEIEYANYSERRATANFLRLCDEVEENLYDMGGGIARIYDMTLRGALVEVIEVEGEQND